MNVDHFFSIGAAHASQGRPCEDYALSGMLPNGVGFGVVADGCSGANAHTDIGVRLAAWAFRGALRPKADAPAQWFDQGFSERLLDLFGVYQFTPQAMDNLATLVGFVATPSHTSVFVQGDGAVAVKFASGREQLVEFNWQDNLPYYLAYKKDPELENEFLAPYRTGAVFPFEQTVTTFEPTADGLSVINEQKQVFSVDQVRYGHVLHFQPEQDNIVALAVMTDGVSQVGARSSVQTCHEFLAYKNYQGEFVKRRMLRALKEFHKNAEPVRDDVGLAAVWFGDAA